MTIRKRKFQIALDEYSEKAVERLKKLEKYDALIKEKCSKLLALQIIEVSRANLTRWKKRYKEEGVAGLEDYSRRPKTIRKHEWTDEMKIRVHNLRDLYPFFGKSKIAIMYQNHYQEKISATAVGKILKHLLYEQKIHSVADICGLKETKRRIFNDHAKRLPKGRKSQDLGDLIQIDHMSVQLPKIGGAKHFNAICPTSKYVVSKTYWQATSHNAENFLHFLIKQMPFPIKSIQVDGGSEFMGDFEKACKKLNIALFVLPPYSPQLNGGVERSNRTYRYEFYALQDGFKSESDYKNQVQKFTDFYNAVRPHQSLGLLTPCQYLERLKIEVRGSYV